MATEKYRYLAKNIGFLTLSSVVTKLLSFFLVPLYTNVLTTAEYGTYDLFATTVSILLPILTLNVQEGVLRFALERDFDRGALVTVGVRCTLAGTSLVALGLVLAVVTGLFPTGEAYAPFLLLMFLVQALGGFATSYIRGIDRVRDLSISSVIASATTIILNIVFLVPMGMGLAGYFLANILGPLSQVIYLAVVAAIPRDVHPMRAYAEQAREMLAYARPLIANSIAWWVNNLSDRYIVVFFCGIAANGVYSIATKIPSMLNLFQTIFNQAWALSSVRDFDPKDTDRFFSNTYRAYNCVMTLVCSAVIVADKALARFLYAKDFYGAWVFVPWLTIAILFGALSGYMGGFFAAVKDSKAFARSTMAGAVTNVAMNLVLVPVLGPLGAAVSTAVCYAEVWAIRMLQSREYITLHLNLARDSVAYLLLVAQSLGLLLIEDAILMYGVLGSLFAVILVLYSDDVRLVGKKLVGAIGKGGK